MPPEMTAEEKKAAQKKAADEAARKKAKSKSDDDSEDDDDVDGDDEGDDPGPDDKLGFTPEQKAYVESLRKESAKYRTKSKELESGLKDTNERLNKFEGGLKKLFGSDEEKNLTAEERIERLEKRTQQEKQDLEQLQMVTALKDAAIEHGVGKADYEYFEFLVNKRLITLKDDEELSDEELAKIAKQAKSKSAGKSTSIDGDEPNPDEDDGELTLEEFMGLGIGARSALYQKDKALYEKLVAQEKKAKTKK